MADHAVPVIIDPLEIRQHLIMRKRIIDHIDHVIFFPYALLIQTVRFRIIYVKLNILAKHFQTGRAVCCTKIFHRTLIQDAEDGNDRDHFLLHPEQFCLQLLHIPDKLLQGYHIGGGRQSQLPLPDDIRAILFLFRKSAELFHQIFIRCTKLFFRKNRLYSGHIQYMDNADPVISVDADIHIHRRLTGKYIIPGKEQSALACIYQCP